MTDEIIKRNPEEPKRIGSDIISAIKNRPAETGARLVEIVTSRAEKSFLNNVINRVEELISHRNNLYIARDKTLLEIALYDKRIAAVESGEFEIDREGRLRFNDILLNY